MLLLLLLLLVLLVAQLADLLALALLAASRLQLPALRPFVAPDPAVAALAVEVGVSLASTSSAFATAAVTTPSSELAAS
eukprot:4235123-Pyramimonas_sp.AAC.1